MYFLFEPGRQDRLLEDFDDKAVERGATLFANNQSDAYDPTKSLLCANCHGVDGGGGTAPYVLQPELDICDIDANKSNPDVPECLPVNAPLGRTPLDTVLLRFDDAQVFNIITYGRPGTPMPAWGVASGKGVLNEQSITDLIAYLHSIQIGEPDAKQRSTKALTSYKKVWAKNAADQADEAVTLQKTADDAKATGKSVDDVAKLQADADEQKAVAASAAAWSAQVNQMNDGEILFRLNCAALPHQGLVVLRPATTSSCRRSRHPAVARSGPTSPTAPRRSSSRTRRVVRSSSTGWPRASRPTSSTANAASRRAGCRTSSIS